MEHIQTFTVENPERLDVFLAEKISESRSQAKKFVDRGLVTVNGKTPKKAGDRVIVGDTVTLESAKQGYETFLQEDVSIPHIPILAETKDYVILDKPAGLLVHPTQAGEQRTLTAWLLRRYPDIADVGGHPDRPGIVHRLDKDASGVLVVAKTQTMFAHLKEQFKKRQVKKIYEVLVYGRVEAKHEIIDFPIDRGKDGTMVCRPRQGSISLKSIARAQPGKQACTEFWIEKPFARFTLLRVQIHSGRTHQIRIHMFAYGHPVVGDMLYYQKKLIKKGDSPLGRLFLHAQELSFIDLAGEMVHASAPLPLVLSGYLDNLN